VEEIARALDHEVKGRFPGGTVLRTELRHGGDPGQLVVRVVIPAAADPAAWTEQHREQTADLRRELSLRLPSARLLEFTSDAPDAPVISLPDDGSLAAEQLSSREIVIKAVALLRENYVFPEQAGQVATAVEARLAAGEYDNLDEITLTELLTSHLQEASGDKHLRVRLGGGPRQPVRQPGRLDNFGIYRAERLAGNIGYLDLRRMAMPEHAGPAIAAAMELVAGTYALIIDLRRNGGGSPDGVAVWCSYLIEDQPRRLNDIFHADTGETRQFWSYPYLPGRRYLDRPVYVLTSSRTFSGGEDFGYTLQALGRAELIGEATGGGAHPTRAFPISAAVHIGIPFARSINPVTGTNWQGTGVIPDTPAPADQAYDVAYSKALRHVLELGDVPPPIADEARDTLSALTS
jgi:Peptidase family S41/N-terminal domain of Peptidase_S41 in eukaryotic IRBP